MLTHLLFENELKKTLHQPNNFKYLLAVSGGADSMVMANLFKDLNLSFEIAHVNYKLRGESSDLDQKTVVDFAQEHQIPIHIYEVTEKDEKPEGSIQLWARNIRYSFFTKIQEEENIEYLVTAHHLNDQLETFIINLSKASGITGLSGIPNNENNVLRPLLKFSKEDIYRFAAENNIEFREDESNKKNDYLRNKIRNEITPLLLDTNDHFLENFSTSITILNQAKNFINQQIDAIFKKLIISQNHNEIIVDREKLASESQFVQFEILKKIGLTNHTEIIKILQAPTGSLFNTVSHQIIIHRNQLLISWKKENQTEENKIMLIETCTSHHQKFKLENNIVHIDEIYNSFSWDFDSSKINFPLYLRKKEAGDTFYPVGFHGSKKVGKFFKDEKLSILAKQKIWLLSDAQNNVLGVIPFRQDRRFAANNNTTNILTIYNEKSNEV